MLWQPSTGKPRLLPFRTAAAGANRPHVTDRISTRPSIPTLPAVNAAPMEEQDARLSGMTRSLHRRISGLNFPIAVPAVAQKVA